MPCRNLCNQSCTDTLPSRGVLVTTYLVVETSYYDSSHEGELSQKLWMDRFETEAEAVEGILSNAEADLLGDVVELEPGFYKVVEEPVWWFIHPLEI